MTVQKRHLKGQDVSVVLVQPADVAAGAIQGHGLASRWPAVVVASPQEERILGERRRHRDAPFDIYPRREADLGELDDNLFREAYLPAAVSAGRSRRGQRHRVRADGLAPPGGTRASARTDRSGLLAIGKQSYPAPADGVRLLRPRRAASNWRRRSFPRTTSKARCPGSAPQTRRTAPPARHDPHRHDIGRHRDGDSPTIRCPPCSRLSATP